MKCIKTTFLLLMLITSSVNVFAQGTWTNYAFENSISDITIHGDYLWCATSNGIVRWDTRDMTYEQYTMSDGLVDNSVRSIAIGLNGDVWAGTSSGVSRFDGETWTTYNSNNVLLYNYVSTIAVDFDGDVWISTFSHLLGGVSCYDGDNWTLYTRDDGLKNDVVNSMAFGSDSVVWFGTRLGATRYDGENWRTFTSASGRLPYDVVESIAIDSNGIVWIGTSGGINRYERGGITRYDGENWKTFTTDDGLADNRIESIDCGADGVVWVRTGNGIIRYDGEIWKTFTTDDGLASNDVYSIEIGPDGIVWFGTREGLSRYEPLPTLVETPDSLPSEIIVHGNYPNPFNLETSIRFMLPRDGNVQLIIYNITGQKIRSLISDRMTAGIHSVRWDGRDEVGKPVSSGMYIALLKMGSQITTHHMLLLK